MASVTDLEVSVLFENPREERKPTEQRVNPKSGGDAADDLSTLLAASAWLCPLPLIVLHCGIAKFDIY